MNERVAASFVARALAIGWLVVVCAIVGHNVWLWFGGHLRIDTDILAMLPQDERDPAVQTATRQLADSAARRVVVLVGGNGWNDAKRGADAFASDLQSSRMPLALRYRVADATTSQWLDFFAPYRRQLLTQSSRTLLSTQTPPALADQAISALYQPLGLPRIGAWRNDPLNLFGSWIAENANASRVRVREGRLSISAGAHQFALITIEQQGPAFSIAAERALTPVLSHARAAARAAAPGATVYMIGVPMYAAAAATQAQHEVDTIGIGSLAGIVLLTLFAFSTIRPRILVTLSIGIGLLAAISACVLVFGRIHLITMVFGASLVGVAENYGTNYFSNRLGRPPAERWAMVRRQAPVLWLAMLTTVIGYGLLALTPFPGLRQIALFSAAGLLAAFVTVLWWFPFLDGGRPMPNTRLAEWIGTRRARWPQLGRNRFTLIASSLVLVVLASGLAHLRTDDDVRTLQHAPAYLVRQQRAVNALLDLPSPAQFYLVQGTTADQVLAREEALRHLLDPLVAAHWIDGYQAVSDWVPSAARQRSDAMLVRRVVDGPKGVLALAARQLAESFPQPSAAKRPLLDVDTWLASPVSEPLRMQWLGRFEGGYASVVLLRGVDSPAKLSRLAAIAPHVPGVRWVDKVAEVSRVMNRYRHFMGWVIVAGYVLVYLALTLRFGRRAWRALVPTALASVLALALLALLSQPLQLFNVLALLLILGLGVDYGIFLLEQPGKHEGSAFLSVTLAAASTLLAFGLLALSLTPALRAFGLTMLFGVGLAWLLNPVFMPSDTSTRQ